MLLAPAGGGPIDPVRLTAEHIAEYQPPPEAVAQATSWFSTAGFEVGPVVGLSFSITARTESFEQAFGVAPPPPGQPYPLDRLPATVRDVVAAVSAPEPIDFGPVPP